MIITKLDIKIYYIIKPLLSNIISALELTDWGTIEDIEMNSSIKVNLLYNNC